MQPRVSVIVPVYNVERFLEECLDSVLAQTFPDFEVVCVNDGSTDSSPLILEQYRARDERIVVVSQENAGLSAARNTGLRHARGEYVAFLDSDDYLAPSMLEKTVAKADEAGAQIVVFDYWLYFDGTGDTGTYRDQALYERLNGSVFDLAAAPEMARFIGVWDRLFRRDFIEENGLRYIEGRIYEDVSFCVESLVRAERIALLSDHLYYYRRDVAGSITQNEGASRRHKEDFLFMQAFAQRCYAQARVGDEVWRNYAWYFVEYALMHQRQIHDYAFFREFFYRILLMASPSAARRAAARTWAAGYAGAYPPPEGNPPELFSMGQVRTNPEQAVYRWLVRGAHPAATCGYLKAMNVARRLASAVLWRAKRLMKG
ncbi:MAG: glycosyltransferase family 2 protein [Berryella intestinalis]|uniref:glycosyltransferase family 2 protein n=1 Tax=Berryella intestinalis TaxID=1531429 RepID=UPI002A591EC2|nr:glycosyltransferase family 2 protein [Berryella intestinalis]MDD7369153.1 glycosyltransferase family 2 protein [Berryella intestinalis]MDY3129090.1 glycosyltransferase family 2 protein [Berryella intestinalis]